MREIPPVASLQVLVSSRILKEPYNVMRARTADCRGIQDLVYTVHNIIGLLGEDESMSTARQAHSNVMINHVRPSNCYRIPGLFSDDNPPETSNITSLVIIFNHPARVKVLGLWVFG